MERPTRHTHWPHPNSDLHMEWYRSSYVALYYRGPSARHTWRAISCRTQTNAMDERLHIRRAIYATLHYRWLTDFNAHPKTFIFYLVHGPTTHLRWHGSTNTVYARSDIDERWLVAWTSTAQAWTCNPPHSCGFTRHALSDIPNCNNRNMRYFLSYQIKALYLSIS